MDKIKAKENLNEVPIRNRRDKFLAGYNLHNPVSNIRVHEFKIWSNPHPHRTKTSQNIRSTNLYSFPLYCSNQSVPDNHHSIKIANTKHLSQGGRTGERRYGPNSIQDLNSIISHCYHILARPDNSSKRSLEQRTFKSYSGNTTSTSVHHLPNPKGHNSKNVKPSQCLPA